MGIFDSIFGGIGSGISGIGNMFNSFLHPEKGYKEGEKAINKSWQEALGYMKPYQQAGLDEYGRLRDATGALLDPAALESQWMKGYEESPYAKHEAGMAKEQGLDAASSMGLMGSSPALEAVQTNTSNILNADRRNYLQDLMQKYLAGINASQNIYGIGAGMGSEIGRGAIGTGENIAKMRYGEKNAPGEMFASLLGQFLSGAGRSMGMGGGAA